MTNLKGRIFVRAYLTAHGVYYSNNFIRAIGYPIVFLYKLFFNYFLTFEIPPEARIGKGLQCYHCFGIVIHKEVLIGKNCTLRHNVTIGNNISGGGVPTIGNNVNIGSGAVIIGDIYIADNVKIGANAMVTKDVPENTTVVGINEFK